MKISLAGVPPEIGTWLCKKLGCEIVRAPADPIEFLRHLQTERPDVLLLDHRLEHGSGLDLLQPLDPKQRPRVLYSLQSIDDPGLLRRLVELGVERILMHPLLPEELLDAIASNCVSQSTRQKITRLWEQYLPANLQRVKLLEEAVMALLGGQLTEPLRQKAREEAHKLAGSLGTFGLPNGSELAQQLEEAFRSGVEAAQTPRLAELVLELERALQHSGVEVPMVEPAGPYVLGLGTAWEGLDEAPCRLRWVEGPEQVWRCLAEQFPACVLLDLDGPDQGAARSLLAKLEKHFPALPVLARTGDLATRAEAVRRGALFVVGPDDQITSLLTGMLRVQPSSQRIRILAVDDDPQILTTLENLLTPAGYHVTTLEDPLQLWKYLTETEPDLLLLDQRLPHLTGTELCRAVRSDPTWANLPILFLTSDKGADTVRSVFRAGANDFISKPVVGPEVLSRVAAWLSRRGRERRLAGGDFGVLARLLLRRAERLELPLTVVRLRPRPGLDELLAEQFANGEAVGRWSEDFAVVALGESPWDLTDRMDRLRKSVPDLSFGMAHYPEHSSIEALMEAAEPGHDELERVTPVDVAVVEDDPSLAALLLHALGAQGYRTFGFQDGSSACQALAGNPPSLRARVLLLDLGLPGLSGRKVLEKVRERAPGTRVIVLTAHSSEADILESLEKGAFDHTTKPFSLPVLLQKVRRALRAS
ncbi:MAG: hypothetical protein AMXMBFR33_12050 [Candidatus Xenobia bacterium]